MMLSARFSQLNGESTEVEIVYPTVICGDPPSDETGSYLEKSQAARKASLKAIWDSVKEAQDITDRVSAVRNARGAFIEEFGHCELGEFLKFLSSDFEVGLENLQKKHKILI